MDELIASFINVNYTYELKEEIIKSLQLAESFSYKYMQDNMMDILMSTVDNSNDMLVDRFIIQLHKDLDYILEQHTLVLDENTSIQVKNKILQALCLLQDLEDYTGVICMLESFEDPTVKLASTIADTVGMEVTDVLIAIESFDDEILDKLKDYIYARETQDFSAVDIDLNPYIENLEAFFQVYGNENVAARFIEGNFRLAEDFDVYLGYIDGDLAEMEDKSLATNLLSIIYMSFGSLNNPIDIYRQHSAEIVKELNRISKIESMIIQMIGQVNEYKNAKKKAQTSEVVKL